MATRRNAELGFRAPGLAETERRLQKFGETGDRALRRIKRGGTQASDGLKALNVVGREGQGVLNDMAGSAGFAGRVLTRLGTVGLLAMVHGYDVRTIVPEGKAWAA